MDKISILMATYNPHTPFFIEQLQSLNRQEYNELELIVVDDCSKPEKQEEIKELLSKYITDIPYQFIMNTRNMGSNKTFERLTELATGDYFAYCDQDDIWETNKLLTLMNKIKNENAVIAYSDLSIIDENGKIVSQSFKNISKRLEHVEGEDLFQYFLRKNSITGCTMLINSGIAKEALPFPPSEIYVHDHWLALYGSYKGKIAYVESPLVRYRIHTNNQIGAKVLVGITTQSEYLDKRVLSEEQKVVYVKSREFPAPLQYKIDLYQQFVDTRKKYFSNKNSTNLIGMFKQIQKDPVLIIFEILLGLSGNYFSKHLLKYAKK